MPILTLPEEAEGSIVLSRLEDIATKAGFGTRRYENGNEIILTMEWSNYNVGSLVGKLRRAVTPPDLACEVIVAQGKLI